MRSMDKYRGKNLHTEVYDEVSAFYFLGLCLVISILK